jgi:tetratricopeptide (TPR) repeat protein
VTGRAAEARGILRRAIVEVDRRDDLPREQVAWFHYRLGELELRTGHVAAADSAFHVALLRHADDVRALGGLARTALMRNDMRRAITYGEDAINIQLDPATLGTLSQAYAALGDSVQAKQFAKAMSLSALTQPGQIHRAWGLFLLDHGTASDRADVLRRARREVRERRDVYGYDVLAWALHRTGRAAEARDAMRIALSQRTEDVLLASHARAILGDGASQ